MERRKEERIGVAEKGVIRLLNPVASEASPVHITNVSINGMGFTGVIPLAPGTLVQIRLTDRFVLGEVRYCTADRENGFRFGIVVESVMELRTAA